MTQAFVDPNVLFGRRLNLLVGSLSIPAGQGTGLDVEFTVKRGVKITQQSMAPQPNTCDLTIFNLSPNHRQQIEASSTSNAKSPPVPVAIAAGYQGISHTIFAGELRTAHTVTVGPRKATTLTTGDGDKALTQARLTLALGKGSSAKQALQQIVASLGVGAGNLQRAITLLEQQPLAACLFARGITFKGAAADIMSDFCRSVGLAWSIQNGALQFTSLGEPLAGQAILIDSQHGMTSSPTVDTKGVLTVNTEMIPGIVPGIAISVQAANIQGGFRVLRVTTKGATDGNDWGHEIEAQRY